jgi:hypothetical protein
MSLLYIVLMALTFLDGSTLDYDPMATTAEALSIWQKTVGRR